jgi:hypothetical protein
MEVFGQIHSPAALSPVKEPPRYPLIRRLSELQTCFERLGKEKNDVPLPEIEP